MVLKTELKGYELDGAIGIICCAEIRQVILEALVWLFFKENVVKVILAKTHKVVNFFVLFSCVLDLYSCGLY